ncbi:MAG: toll/interleukin-1 receptor domain-containing protein [Zoogloeaceae bacterium]|nr:toll/interleukin-1 receptor domain-containing protein [Rhodocyclaceae bacterium]MCP5237818.1 toll/interleukin-1 receptor domain-containing protein [Zoogloeaceae bacterium]
MQAGLVHAIDPETGGLVDMAFSNHWRNDVFVSYAHTDNEIGPSGVRWVSQFTQYLDTSLKQRLGCGDCLRVFFDKRDLSSNQELASTLDEVRHSAIFIAITTPSYVNGSWTRRELEAFTEQAQFQDRLFVIEMSPLDSLGDYPPPIDTKPRAKFWHRPTAESRVPLPLDPQIDPQLYTQRLLDFAEHVRKRLLALHQQSHIAPAPPAREDSPAKGNGDPNRCTVLLAQATDELEFEREQVKSYLQQMNVSVLPEGDYPQGGASFKQAFAADLARADLFVQLLGKAAGRKPPDLPDGYIQTQFALASAAGRSMMLWRHPELDVDQIGDPAQRRLLTSESVIASGLEAFKTEIVRSIKMLRASKAPAPSSLVYLGAERSDIEVARQLSEALKAHRFPVVLPTFEGSSEEIRQDLEENLMESDTLVFVYGSAPTTWIRGNLRRLHKLMAQREKPPRRVAIFTAPPPKAGDIGVSFPYLETIDSSGDLDPDPLITLLEDDT